MLETHIESGLLYTAAARHAGLSTGQVAENVLY